MLPHAHMACMRASVTIWRKRTLMKSENVCKRIFRAVANINVKIKLRNGKKKSVFNAHEKKRGEERKIDN